MPAIDLSILNQRQTPAFYADTLANRPAAGFVGRIFVSTNTFAFFRDNGTSWDLIGGPGTGTVTGSGAAGQVSFWNGANTITGNNNLFWDNVNGHLGIGTTTPGTALGINHNQNQVIQLNQTTVTNDTKIAFQNSGVALWRIGNSYNAGANDFGIYDVVGSIQPVTVKKTTGQVLIGTSTVGSGKLVVASATGDNGVQIVGASAPSLRIDNAESGATKRAGFGISTATNNFIQGSADRDFCMFNGSTTASPILFGIYDAAAVNVQEAARISPARNFLIGTTTDAGQKLQVNGNSYINGTLGIGVLAPTATLHVTDLSGGNVFKFASGTTVLEYFVSGGNPTFGMASNNDLRIMTNSATRLTITSAGNVGIGTTSPTVASGLGLVLNGQAAQTRLAFKNNYTGDTSSDGVQLALIGGSSAFVFQNRESDGYFAFEVNANEVFRTSGTNLLIGTTTDAGQKLQVAGMTYSGISYRAGTYTQGDTTPSVSGISFLPISNTTPTTITNFTSGSQHQVITLYFSDSNTTIDRSNCYLAGGVNFTSTASDTITLINNGGFWYEVSRSVNS